METVGFIGLGNMGMGMAGNIQKADYPMVVYDLRQTAIQPFVTHGARQAGSPAEVASLSEVIFTSLPGPQEVEEVATGKVHERPLDHINHVFDGLRDGSIEGRCVLQIGGAQAQRTRDAA